MKRTIDVLAVAAALAAAPTLGSTAQAFSTTGTLNVNAGDTYTIACTSAATHCIEMKTCDAFASSADIFQEVLAVTSPISLIGKTQNEIAINGSCSSSQRICRAGATVGVMKGLGIITHPSGSAGATSSVEIHCFDKNGLLLPESKLKVTQTEDNH